GDVRRRTATRPDRPGHRDRPRPAAVRRAAAESRLGPPPADLCSPRPPSIARLISSLIDQRRRQSDPAVLFVTNEVNPVLPYVDRVLYLVDGRFRVGAVEDVMTSATLSELYRADIEVVKVGGRYVVVGQEDYSGHASGHDHD